MGYVVEVGSYMAHGVNLWITNWQWTGSTVPCPQATVDIDKIEWDNESGHHTWSGTATFPNDLQDVPVAWLKEELEDLILRVLRKRLGIDEA